MSLWWLSLAEHTYMSKLGPDIPSTYISLPPSPTAAAALILPCCRRLSFDTFAPLLSERIIAQSQGLKEEHDYLRTILRGRGRRRFYRPSFCSYL
jgi:hypothetical protein